MRVFRWRTVRTSRCATTLSPKPARTATRPQSVHGRRGVAVQHGSVAHPGGVQHANITIAYNNLLERKAGDVVNNAAAGQGALDATHNWWGSRTGPTVGEVVGDVVEPVSEPPRGIWSVGVSGRGTTATRTEDSADTGSTTIEP